uniref:Uncharacterized protein n=1 Tax=Nicotiana tabacum TaxID=4097 RepID=A0A1S3ZLB6_TOBAC|nr:PREDICTED: uncharacterized protein LOC107788018 [Nicotiana tabacum]
MEDLMKAFIIKTDEKFETYSAAIRNLERQVGQIASLLSKRSPGTIPVNTEKNPKETINAVSLRNDKVLQGPLVAEKNELTRNQVKNEVRAEQEDDLKKKNKSKVPKLTKKYKQRSNDEIEESKYMSALPFPQKQRREKLDKQFRRFLEVLKQVHVNISFTEVLSQMPAYTKFLKEIFSNKRKVEETSAVKLTEHCRNWRERLEKSDLYLCPCSWRIIPEGIVKDVLVQVDKFVFPVDFIMVNMEENREILLGY